MPRKKTVFGNRKVLEPVNSTLKDIVEPVEPKPEEQEVSEIPTDKKVLYHINEALRLTEKTCEVHSDSKLSHGAMILRKTVLVLISEGFAKLRAESKNF